MQRPLNVLRPETAVETDSGAPQAREIGPVMDGAPPTEYLTRDSILELLSDDEISKVSTAEGGFGLADHDDYVDLQELERGVQRAHGASASVGNVLPKKAVRPETWDKIVSLLARIPAFESPGEP